MKAETPATSDVEAALDQTAEDYVSLLIGLVNALPKPKKGADSKDAGNRDEVDEFALEMEADSGGLSRLLHAYDHEAHPRMLLL